jgi:hypothetical protein
MKRKIVVNPKARIAHIPKELIDQGLSGELDGYADAVSLTIVNPKTPLRDVEKSLKIVLRDIQFRRELEEGNDERDEAQNRVSQESGHKNASSEVAPA